MNNLFFLFTENGASQLPSDTFLECETNDEKKMSEMVRDA